MRKGLTEENWLPVKDFEGIYEVSDKGQVRRMAGSAGCHVTRLLSPGYNKGTGYQQLHLSKGGIQTNKQIHRLVAEAFIPNPENKLQVNHIDAVKTNNSLENLEWCTRSENAYHALKMGVKSNTTPIQQHAVRLMNKTLKSKRYWWMNEKKRKQELFYGSMSDLSRLAKANKGGFWRVSQGIQKTYKGWEVIS